MFQASWHKEIGTEQEPTTTERMNIRENNQTTSVCGLSEKRFLIQLKPRKEKEQRSKSEGRERREEEVRKIAGRFYALTVIVRGAARVVALATDRLPRMGVDPKKINGSSDRDSPSADCSATASTHPCSLGLSDSGHIHARG